LAPSRQPVEWLSPSEQQHHGHEMTMIKPPQRHVWRSFQQLSTEELYSLLRLRCEVFVVEQRCAYLDIDGSDEIAEHLLARGFDDRLCGYLRAFAPGKLGPAAHIGRVVTSPADRGTGLGTWLVQEALDFIAQRFGDVQVELAAQVHLERFYESFGFRRSSETYPLDGILHCDMLRAKNEGSSLV
jgi:ElaA protein